MVCAVALLVGCGAAPDRLAPEKRTPEERTVEERTPEERTPEERTPEERTVRIETEGCGHASATQGSGVLIDDGQVVTVAHLVAGSSAVIVVVDGVGHEARIAAYDSRRDLALLSVPAIGAEPVELEAPTPTESGRIVGAMASGTVTFIVERAVQIDIDEVRGTTRSVRSGYELRARTEAGDSGAGAFDDHGRLVGIVFGVSPDNPDRTWITAASEIEDFLGDTALRAPFACDLKQSKLIAQEASGG